MSCEPLRRRSTDGHSPTLAFAVERCAFESVVAGSIRRGGCAQVREQTGADDARPDLVAACGEMQSVEEVVVPVRLAVRSSSFGPVSM